MKNLFAGQQRTRGFTLIEVLIAASIGVILVLAFTSTLVSQLREMRWLLNKSDVLETKTNLTKTLQNGSVCSWQFRDKEFNVSGISTTQPSTTEIAIDRIHEGTSATSKVAVQLNGRLSSSNQNLSVTKIALMNIVETGVTDHYAGDLAITFVDPSTSRSFQPLRVALKFRTSAVNPSVRRIIECEQETSAVSADGHCDWYNDFNAAVADGSAVCSQPIGHDVRESDVPAAERDKYVWIDFPGMRIARRTKVRSIPDPHWVPSGVMCVYQVPTGCGSSYMDSMSCAGGIAIPVYKSYPCPDQSG